MLNARNSPQRACLAHLPRSSGNAGGFTLLELLVAIMVLTLVMAAVFGAVRLSGRSYEAGNQRAEASEEMRSVTDFLRRQFARLIPVAMEDEVTQFAFAGDAMHIRFVASAPQYPSAVGLITYTISTDEHADRQRLVLSYGPFDPGAGDAIEFDSNRQLTLADDLTAISFRFFGAKAPIQSKPAWHDTWLGVEDGLPELVRITMAVSNRSHWPELIFKIRAEDPS
jgi:general secretion pathway protein J